MTIPYRLYRIKKGTVLDVYNLSKLLTQDSCDMRVNRTTYDQPVHKSNVVSPIVPHRMIFYIHVITETLSCGIST